MSETDDTIDPQKALRHMAHMAPQFAQARANRIYCEEYRKTLKARLMKQALVDGHNTVNAQEREAYADEGYAQHLLAMQAAVEAEETLRWKLIAAEAAVEVWRSMEASNRRMDRATQ